MKKLNLLIYISVIVMLSSCGVNSNVMFKVPKGDITYDSIPMTPQEDYRISVDDKLTFTLFTNNGAEIIDLMSGVSEKNRVSNTNYEFVVRRNGEVELPVIGKVPVAGLTIEACEDSLANRFSMYQQPFVQVRLTNQRVIVFPGNGSDAKVIPLINSNTTLMEALAQAGGITDRGKANTIKLMRKVNGERVIYGIDLSTIEGLKYADMIVQANDYIYVEPTPDLGKEIAEDIVPVISIFSSALVIFSAITLLK